MKIIGSDYDGTLNHGGFDAAKLTAIKRWQEKGNKFGVISGRNQFFGKEIEKNSGIKLDYFIACNGAVVLDSAGNTICETLCRDVAILPFAERLFELGCDFVHMCGREYFRIRKCEKDLKDGEYLTGNAPEADGFYQISVQLPTEAEAAVLTGIINREYAGRLNALLNGVCIDIVPHGVNKAYGMNIIKGYYGASHEDIITVGDNINDADMIRAFRSYAMKSGAQAIIQLAGNTVESVTELIDIELKAEPAV